MDRRQLFALGLGVTLLVAAWLLGFGSYVSGGGEFAAVHRVVLLRDGGPAPKGSAHGVVELLSSAEDGEALRALVEEEIRAVLGEEGTGVASLEVRLVDAPEERPPDAVIRDFRSDYRWSMTWPWGRDEAEVVFEVYLGCLRGEPPSAQVVELDLGGRWSYRGPAGFPGAALERVQQRVFARTRARIQAESGFELAPEPTGI